LNKSLTTNFLGSSFFLSSQALYVVALTKPASLFDVVVVVSVLISSFLEVIVLSTLGGGTICFYVLISGNGLGCDWIIVSYFGWLYITVSYFGLDELIIVSSLGFDEIITVSSFGFEDIIVSYYFYTEDWIRPVSFLAEVISTLYFWMSFFTNGLFNGLGFYYAPLPSY